jgi:uncharacterized delta-60 repeat protein
VVGGDFTTLAGAARNNIGRLNTNGTLDTAFNPGANDDVETLALQPDGKILVGGYFTRLGGSSRSGIGRLNSTGSLDTGFNPGASAPVRCLAVQSDGKILVGGYFTNLGGQARSYIGRLNTNGTIDTAFNPGANAAIDSFALQADGKILVGGEFSTMGGLSRSRIARLHPDGTVDLTFNPGSESPGPYLGIQADGKILRGGDAYQTFARLNNTGPATETLIYANSTITWLRGGTSPEVWQTTFERSTDGMNWTSLGAGARVPGGWQLAGVSLPSSGALRARGFVAGGRQNASAWFVETVIDLIPAIRLTIARSGSSMILSWTGGQGPYQVQQSSDLSQASWQNVGTPVQTNSISLPTGDENLFLRVRQ